MSFSIDWFSTFVLYSKVHHELQCFYCKLFIGFNLSVRMHLPFQHLMCLLWHYFLGFVEIYSIKLFYCVDNCQVLIKTVSRCFRLKPDESRTQIVKKYPYQGFLHLKYLLRNISSKDFCCTKQFMTNDPQTVSRSIRNIPYRRMTAISIIPNAQF